MPTRYEKNQKYIFDIWGWTKSPKYLKKIYIKTYKHNSLLISNFAL